MVKKTFYGTTELVQPGGLRPWIARLANGQIAGWFGTDGEARKAVQAYAGLGAPLTWSDDTGGDPGLPERYKGEFITN